jgi:hypothetical protein
VMKLRSWVRRWEWDTPWGVRQPGWGLQTAEADV